MSRSPNLTVDIVALGGGGDGIAETGQGRIFVPGSVPGDRLVISAHREKGGALRGDIVERLEDGADRAIPICRHFGTCGGCAVQHVAPDAYRDWKRGLVRQALARRGFDGGIVGDLAPGLPGRRRRARFFVRMTAGGVALGFREARSHRIVTLAECPVLAPEIAALLPSLSGLCESVFASGDRAELAATLTDAGLDMTVFAGREPGLEDREALAGFSEAHDLARISWGLFGVAATAEPVVRRRAATVMFGGVALEPPPDAFLQATVEGESALRERIGEALADAGRVADLYAGCGAFALPLAAAGRHVLAIDAAGDHVDALDAAARANGLGPMVNAATRDLHHRPLELDELKGLDAVVLDPPRAGAARQAALLAESDVAVIAYASCDPRTFARDARLLCDGGYRLDAVTPIDQFLFTPHVELVGIFSRS